MHFIQGINTKASINGDHTKLVWHIYFLAFFTFQWNTELYVTRQTGFGTAKYCNSFRHLLEGDIEEETCSKLFLQSLWKKWLVLTPRRGRLKVKIQQNNIINQINYSKWRLLILKCFLNTRWGLYFSKASPWKDLNVSVWKASNETRLVVCSRRVLGIVSLCNKSSFSMLLGYISVIY